MKKILLTAFATTVVSLFSTHAEESIYLGIEGGVTHFLKVEPEYYRKGKIQKLEEKLKTDHAPFANLSLGYEVMEKMRAELALGYHFNPELSFKVTEKDAAELKYSTKLDI